MNFRAVPRGHTLYYEIVTGTRALAAERDGFTERPWRGGARGACGIRRFNHPRGDRDGARREPRARARATVPCYWPARRPRPPGRDTAALMLQVKIERRPGQTRRAPASDAPRLPYVLTTHALPGAASTQQPSTWQPLQLLAHAVCHWIAGIPCKIYKAGCLCRSI